MQLAGALIVILCAWLAGRAMLPLRAVLPRSRWEEACLAYLLGAAALVLTAMALSWAGLVFTTFSAWLILLGGATAGILRWKADRARKEPFLPAPFGRWSGVLIGVLGLGAAVVVVSVPLNEFDAIIHWAFKGKILYYTGDVRDEAFTGVQGLFGRVHTHPNYPLGVPFLEAFSAHAGFGWSERWVQLPLAFWTACLPAVVSLGLRTVGNRAAGMGALLMACVPFLYARDFLNPFRKGLLDLEMAGFFGRVILGGGTDLPLAALFAAGVVLLLRARQSGSRRLAILSGVALAGGILMKNEGLGLVAVLAVALVLAAPKAPRRQWAIAGLCLGACLLSSLPWLLHRSHLPAVDENYSEIFFDFDRIGHFLTHEEVVPEGLSEDLMDQGPAFRPVDVPEYFLLEFINPFSWGALWILFWLSLPLGKAFRDADARFLTLCVLGGLFLYALIMLVTPWFLFRLRITGIPERLMLHLVGPAALLVGRRLFAPRGGGPAPQPAPTIKP